MLRVEIPVAAAVIADGPKDFEPSQRPQVIKKTGKRRRI